MKIKLDILVRINLADFGAFEELLSDQIQDPEVLELNIIQPDKQTTQDVVPEQAVPKRKPNRSGTRITVTTESVLLMRKLHKDYPAMQYKDIRKTVENELGCVYGLSTISEVIGRSKYNTLLTATQLKLFPSKQDVKENK